MAGEKEDSAAPRPRMTPEQRQALIVKSVMAREDGRQFVGMILAEFSVNRSPFPHEKAKMQKALPPVEATIYNAAQQDVVRWLIGLCARHAPAQFREMAVESYIRAEHEGEQP